MSKHAAGSGRVTTRELLKRKLAKQRVSMITCYDAAFAKLIEDTEIDVVLVGDSVGNVMLGFPDTLSVTMDMMVHHTAAVRRGLQRPLLVADMPFGSYQESPEQALRNAVRLVQDAGAQAVKVEGGAAVLPQVRKIVGAGIPVMAHLGLTPQSVHQLGGYLVQGREKRAAEILISEAQALAEAGAFALVLELVPRELAAQVTATLSIPTIGIGAGPDTDGQVLVLQDLLGFDAEFSPKFLKRYAQLGDAVKDAVRHYDQDVKAGTFPTDEHSFR